MSSTEAARLCDVADGGLIQTHLQQMSTTKHRVDVSCRVYDKSWTAKSFFTKAGGKAVSFICNKHLAVFQDYNLRRKCGKTQKSIAK